MNFLGFGILSWMTFLPVAGMVIVLALSKEKANAIRWTSALVTAVQLVLAVVIFLKFNRGMAGVNTQEGFQFLEKASWIDVKSFSWVGRIHIDYLMGIDGLSVLMVIITAIISFVQVCDSVGIKHYS